MNNSSSFRVRLPPQSYVDTSIVKSSHYIEHWLAYWQREQLFLWICSSENYRFAKQNMCSWQRENTVTRGYPLSSMAPSWPFVTLCPDINIVSVYDSNSNIIYWQRQSCANCGFSSTAKLAFDAHFGMHSTISHVDIAWPSSMCQCVCWFPQQNTNQWRSHHHSGIGLSLMLARLWMRHDEKVYRRKSTELRHNKNQNKKK